MISNDIKLYDMTSNDMTKAIMNVINGVSVFTITRNLIKIVAYFALTMIQSILM